MPGLPSSPRSALWDGAQGLLTRHRFLVAFAALSTLMGTSVGVARVTTSLYAVELGAGPRVLGLIAASQSVGILVVSLPIGVLVDRLGPRVPFVAGSLLAGLTYALIPSVREAWFLLVCTAAISFFMPLRFVSLNTLFMRELERVGVAKAGWYRGTHMVGMVLAGPLLAVTAGKLVGFAGTFWFIALLFGLTIALSPIVFGRYGARDAGAPLRSLSVAELRGQLALLVGDRALLHTCAVEAVGQAVSSFFAFFILVIAVSSLRMTDAEATQLISWEGGAFMLALFLLGEPVARVGQAAALRASLWVAALGVTTLGLAHSGLLLTVGSVLSGLGIGTLQVISLTRYATLGARHGRGKISGITPLVGTVGSLLGSAVGGTLGPLVGLQASFLAFVPPLLALLWPRAEEL